MKLHALAAAILLAVPFSIAIPGVAPAQSTIHLVAPPLMIVKGAEKPIQAQSATLTTEVNGGLARTTIEITFHNPNARRLEGELQFPLQAGQQVSGFALDVDGRIRAAVPVEKAKGQEVFEAVERHGVDPGLLEQTAGNQFRLRVYPIPANGDRHVRIAIDQSLVRANDGWRLQLPLAFARGADGLSMQVIARGQGGAPMPVGGFGDVHFVRDGAGYAARLASDSPTLGAGLTLRFEAANRPQAFLQDFGGQRYFHAEVLLTGVAIARPMPKTIGLLWDSSASARHRDIDSELAVLDRYFKAVGDGQVRLTRLRDVAEAERDFTIHNGDWSALRAELRNTVYDGASALADWKPQDDVQEYLLVSDGFSNYGTAREMPKLAPAQRLYALDSAGSDSDVARLNAWADARGGRLVSLQGSAGVAQASRDLLTEGPRLVGIEGLGADGLVAASRYPQAGYLRIAGRLRDPAATITLVIGEQGRQRRIHLPVDAKAPVSGQVAALWAGYTVAALEDEPDLHRAQIHELGSRFGLVTAQTSLIVLENASDYVRYDIAPPQELRAQVDQLLAARDVSQATAKREQLDKIAGDFADKAAWWEKVWPKDKPKPPPTPKASARQAQLGYATEPASAGHGDRLAPPPPPPPSEAPMVADAVAEAAPLPAPTATVAPDLDRVEVTGSSAVQAASSETAAPAASVEHSELKATVGSIVDNSNTSSGEAEPRGDATNPNIGIAMHAWQPDAPYAQRLHAAKADEVYAVYLDERNEHADSSAFYLDAASVLFDQGQRQLALRVLSNLAEMNLENRQLLRVLGYRLMQAGQTAQAVVVFEHVSRLAPDEPQSWRDLGLALDAAGREQEAVDDLYKVVSGTWDSRFPSIDLIALGELDAIVARARTPLDTHAIDPRLLRNLPLDLRVVLSWDSDNTDIDLWVTDPNGEKTFYSAPHSYQGGWLSHDCTQGYGPEEFILRKAKPGKYKVEANFFGDHSQLITGPTSIQLHLFTGFGTPQQKDQAVTMRLADAQDTVLVGEFDVK